MDLGLYPYHCTLMYPVMSLGTEGAQAIHGLEPVLGHIQPRTAGYHVVKPNLSVSPRLGVHLVHMGRVRTTVRCSRPGSSFGCAVARITDSAKLAQIRSRARGCEDSALWYAPSRGAGAAVGRSYPLLKKEGATSNFRRFRPQTATRGARNDLSVFRPCAIMVKPLQELYAQNGPMSRRIFRNSRKI